VNFIAGLDATLFVKDEASLFAAEDAADESEEDVS
jgi:hypothetical protein